MVVYLFCLILAVLVGLGLAWLAEFTYPLTVGFFGPLHLSWMKVAYLLIILIVPPLIFTLYPRLVSLWRRIQTKPTLSLFVRAFTFIFVVTVLLWHLLKLDLTNFYAYAPDKLPTYTSPKVWALGLGFMVLTFLFEYLRNQKRYLFTKIITLLGLLLVTGLSLWMAQWALLNEYHHYNANALNLSAVLHPVIQTYFGKAVLINQKSQYGMYPYFLEPIFRLWGDISIFRFSVIMSAMVFASIFSVGLFLWLKLQNKVLAVLGLAAMLFFHYFSIMVWPHELYFQYYPLRTFFPSLLILLFWVYLQKPRSWYLSCLWVLASISILWNLDVGIFCFGAILVALGYQVMVSRDSTSQKLKVLVHQSLTGCTILLTTFTVFSLYLHARYGAWPQLAELLSAQKLFLSGAVFSLNHLWTVIVLIYLLGLLVVAGLAPSKPDRREGTMLIFLLTLGVGIFTYHLNNLHDSVLTNCGYPAIILLSILVDRALVQKGGRYWGILGVALLSLLAAVFARNLKHSQVIRDEITLRNLINPRPASPTALWAKRGICPTCVSFVMEGEYANNRSLNPDWVNKAEYMDEYTLPNSAVRHDLLILSNWDYLLYLHARAESPLRSVNFRHLFLPEEWTELYNLVESRQPALIILDEEQALFFGVRRNHPTENIDLLLDLIRANYHQVRSVVVGSEFYDYWHDNAMSTWERN